MNNYDDAVRIYWYINDLINAGINVPADVSEAARRLRDALEPKR